MMVFYVYDEPGWDSELGRAGVHGKVFIAYNCADGETAFFRIVSESEPYAEDGPTVIPFDDEQMAIVNKQYLQYCTDKGQVYADPAFNVDRHKEFMRDL